MRLRGQCRLLELKSKKEEGRRERKGGRNGGTPEKICSDLLAFRSSVIPMPSQPPVYLISQAALT